MIAKDLALKVLGGLAVGGTVIGGGIAISRYNKEDPELKELREKGLDCGNDYCTLAENKTLTVKHENNTRELTAIPKEAEGKIRIHKSKEGDKSKFSFSIEGGDIAPTWATTNNEDAGDVQGSPIDKLEEFETYEIEEGTSVEGQPKKYFFRRKTKAADEIKKLLGLGDCSLPTNNTDSTCELDTTKLKAINFEGKTKDPTIAESGKATLTISLVADNDKNFDTTNYPFDYKFVLSGEKQVKIPVGPKEIVKKANESVEFRIKVTPVTGGPKKLTIEKIWDVERLAGKLTFTDCNKDTKTCKFPKTINVYKSATESVKDANVTDHTDKTISFEEGVSGYEGEVKFSLKTQVAISGGTPKDSSSITTIEVGDYEIKQQNVVADATT